MNGLVALHGGGEFQAGDEPFLAAILASAAHRMTDRRPIRVAIVPTAAARGRPDLAAANGVAALGQVAADGGLDVEVGAVPVVDARSAADPGLTARLAEADGQALAPKNWGTAREREEREWRIGRFYATMGAIWTTESLEV